MKAYNKKPLPGQSIEKHPKLSCETIKFELIEAAEIILKTDSSGKLHLHNVLGIGELFCDNDFSESQYITLNLKCPSSLCEFSFDPIIDASEKKFRENDILCFKPKRGRHSILSYTQFK